MQLTYRHSYPGTPEEVVALMRNEEFISDVAQHAGATSHSVHITDEATTVDMTLSVPGEVAKFVGGSVHVSQTFRWRAPEADGTRRGTVDVAVKGLPVAVDAVGILRPLTDGTEGIYEGDLNVRIPLVGRKVEQQIRPFIDDAFSGIERRAQDWLMRPEV